MVELGDARLAAYLAEKKPTGQPFFRNGRSYIYLHYQLNYTYTYPHMHVHAYFRRFYMGYATNLTQKLRLLVNGQ